MGNNFEAVVDIEATEDDASGLADLAVRWLIDRGVIGPVATDCVLGTDTGYPPGPNYATAVEEPDGRLARLRTNGVEVAVGRRVYYPTQGQVGPVVCPLCGYSVALEESTTSRPTAAWATFNDALTDWWQRGAGTVACPNCGSALTINEWRWPDEWPVAVGHLGLTFWSWPRLTASFVAELAAHLGHRVVVTRGKL